MTIKFDDKGLVVDSQDEIFNDMVANAKTRLAPYLQGTELQTDESSILGRLLRVVSVPAFSNAEVLQTVLNQFDLNTAEGTQLDFLGWNIHRMRRLGLAAATGTVVLGGDVGVTISEGSIVANSLTGDQFQTEDDVTLDANGAVGIVITVDEIKDNYTISYSIDSYLSDYPDILVARLSESTKTEIANRIASAINDQSTLLRATVNNDGTITVLLINKVLTGDFGVSDGLSITQSYKPVAIRSLTYQTSEAKVGSITSIQSSVLGWRSVNNYLVVSASRAVETDEEYRTRLNYCLGYAVGSYDAVWLQLMSIRGVSFVAVRENTSTTANGEIYNAGVAITVQGGAEDEVAQKIFDAIPVGIMTSGSISKSVKDINGGQHTISFSRPVQVPLSINMSITIYNNFPANGKQLIKQAIVDWFNNLRVGDDVYYSRLYQPINTVQGFSVNSLTIGIDGQELKTDNIPISYNQIPVISADRIVIGGA